MVTNGIKQTKTTTFVERHKKPDSSPVTESWERNARDCIAKVHTIWNMKKISWNLYQTESDIILGTIRM